MPQQPPPSRHCPFLNRAEERCAGHFSLEGLDRAFRYCFDRYTLCPAYLQLLVERRVRRSEAAARNSGGGGEGQNDTDGNGQRYVQITVSTAGKRPRAKAAA
jgi:hypothetical protein